jgi:hypothetical protein
MLRGGHKQKKEGKRKMLRVNMVDVPPIQELILNF